MSNVGIAYRNRAVSGLTADAGSWNATYPRANVLDPLVKKIARTSNAAITSTRLRLNLGANRLLRGFGVKEHNLSESGIYRFRAGPADYDLDFTTGVKDERLSYTGGVNGTTINGSGIIVTASLGRIYHDPGRLDNGCAPSEDMTGTGWAGANGGQVIDASTIVLPAGGSVQQSGVIGFMPSVGYNVSCLARVISGTASAIKVALHDGAVDHTSTSTGYDVGAEWELLTQGIATNSGAGTSATNGKIIIYNAGSTEVVLQVKKWQVSGGDAGSAGLAMLTDAAGNRSYRKTTSARLHRCLGLLREPERTQLLAQTDILTAGAVWTKGANLTANGINGSLLGLTAYQFTSTATSDSYFGAYNVVVSVSTTYVASFLCSVTLSSALSYLLAYTSGGANAVQHPFTFRLIAPGVFLATVTFTTTSVQDRVNVHLGAVNATNGTTFRVAGPDLTAGDVRSSHIPNAGGAGTTVTRTADAASVSGLSGYSKGTMFVEHASLEPLTATFLGSVAALQNPGGNSYIQLRNISNDTTSANVAAAGVTIMTGTSATMTLGTPSRIAASWNGSDIRNYVDGVNRSVAATGSAATDMTVLSLAVVSNACDVVSRVALWTTPLSNEQLDAITTSGPGAIGFDSGWMTALQGNFTGDVPSDWGKRGYDLLACASAHFLGRYVTLEIQDAGNSAGYVELGRLFVGQMLQPAELNPVYGEWNRGRRDLSSHSVTPTGVDFSTARRRQKHAFLKFVRLTEAEANEVQELHDYCGTTEEVLFFPDPSDMAHSQREGGLCLLEELGPLDYPMYDAEAVGFKLLEKI